MIIQCEESETNDVITFHGIKKNVTGVKHSLTLFSANMNITSPGSVTISGAAVLQFPRAVDPQKGSRNIVFDANFCIVEGSQTATMGLL